MTLIDRLSKLDGSNRRLDHEMHILFFVPDDKRDTVEWNHFGSYSWSPSPDHVMIDKVPAYTASVDAAIALAERVLPGWVFDNVGQDYEGFPGGYKSFGWTVEMVNGKRVQGQAPTLPMAICIAILRAKEVSHGE
ncbi:hypothetical protein [Brucella pseudogrignonensis]|uniref:Phage ABA sandwich domain-containing protein n=1 Tax=Brucella pseudogrignonensis TaxID=419475 RepID=A0A256GF77_9HYPH|nr:hypothetical protein [Brucella pseudogrignonensis]NKX16248.1 hypothetical protein [Brucella pseudogrignonensis]OYR25795.1 hypothetical protein CEV34_2639 [Brucella pseudogrignonensis]